MDYSERQPGEEKPVKKKKHKAGPSRGIITLWVIVSLLTVMILIVGGVAFYIWNGLRPTSAGEVKQVELKQGMSPFKFAEVLEDQDIIRNAFIFKYYLRLKDEGPRFQAGVYELKPGMDKTAIIAKLNAGETLKEETIRFTIPEGYTVEQIADTLSKAGVVERAAFLKLTDTDKTWGDAESVRSIPKNKQMKHRLEGYMFPETYELEKGSTPDMIIERMLKELDRKLNGLPENWEETLAEREIDFHQLMTIASLVEREVVVDEERPIVAGIIYNRLAKKMPLQIDATVQYSLDKPKERLYEKDLLVDSPYNTYQIKGLPPGPIASPSLKSIEAALFPEKTEFFYYVTKKDGSNKHLFARTLKEHNKNIRDSKETSQ
ncbi:endolytic transglycosylase MltG [Paenibacillus mendelii]|uniref:Endolytic murein transglycosylase n=1 Tax=Paenibacillus mendelii TaxID=206163 RepID=A0ABV6JAU6_9BACL|nr:endolytic transglycosylase MltG [Paenibacillus mendelii]MCQ6560922.1 endolytic transglycosylase MltG [Paenibacillus mendelii]